MTVSPEIDVFIDGGKPGLALGVYGEVRHIAGMMALRIVHPVFLIIRIKVGARGFKVGSFTLRVLMEVNRVLARWKILQVELHLDPGRRFANRSIAHGSSIGIFQ